MKKITSLFIFLIIIFIISACAKINKKDLGLGYSTEDYNTEVIDSSFIKDNNVIKIHIYPIDHSKYEKQTNFFESIELSLNDKGFKKINNSIEWLGDESNIYVTIKSDIVDVRIFKKGIDNSIYKYVSSDTLPSPDDVLYNVIY